MEFFYPNQIMFELKIYSGVACHGNEGAKLEEEQTCHFKIDMSALLSSDTSTRKSQKFAL